MPKCVRASAKTSVMPLSNASNGPSVAAIRGPVGVTERCNLSSSAKPPTSGASAFDAKSESKSPLGETRAKLQRETGTTDKIPERMGKAGSDSGIALRSSGARS